MKNPTYFLLLFLWMVYIPVSCTHPYTQGQALYEVYCSRCHGMNGKGFEDLYPGILQSTYVNHTNPNLACVITYGSNYLVTQNNTRTVVSMPGNEQLSAVEVLNILNFISSEFGNGNTYRIDEIMKILESCNHL